MSEDEWTRHPDHEHLEYRVVGSVIHVRGIAPPPWAEIDPATVGDGKVSFVIQNHAPMKFPLTYEAE